MRKHKGFSEIRIVGRAFQEHIQYSCHPETGEWWCRIKWDDGFQRFPGSFPVFTMTRWVKMNCPVSVENFVPITRGLRKKWTSQEGVTEHYTGYARLPKEKLPCGR